MAFSIGPLFGVDFGGRKVRSFCKKVQNFKKFRFWGSGSPRSKFIDFWSFWTPPWQINFWPLLGRFLTPRFLIIFGSFFGQFITHHFRHHFDIKFHHFKIIYNSIFISIYLNQFVNNLIIYFNCYHFNFTNIIF
jgi:hypothetical protein